ncbi:DUF5412 family protein [Ornithinibacillus sp. 179-J 7C1 HS]|uniref:DUF5412 family protein n=1 Tax=Ornithinibacillus sp. 179-J 7C1 HS TaxID=3142384 RepID=UPI0039A13705
MAKRYNVGSFYLILVCFGLGLYSLYSNLNHTWMIAQPNYILLVFSLLAFVFGIIGFKDKRNWRTKIRSWFTIILSLLMAIVLSLAVLLTLFASSLGANEYIKTVQSPDGKYTIDFYRYDAGALGSHGIRGELNGPLWFKKRIYYRDREEQVEVEWKNNSTISINNHTLNLKKGETYGY